MGSCGTMGDANADYLAEVLAKYYTYDFEGLSFIKVTGPQLVNFDDVENTGFQALEYILAQESIDNSILYQEESKFIGIGCGCETEDYEGEQNWSCFIVTADSVRGRKTDIYIPAYQSVHGWE